MKLSIVKITCVIFLLLISKISNGQGEPEIYEVDGVAIAGFDPVAFFYLNMAKKAAGGITYTWKGATWWFISEDHKSLFKEDPEKYAPQFGGYCAWGMREGYKAETHPKKAWTIYEGALYLNYNKGTMKGWLPEKEDNIRIAKDNWSKMAHQ